MNEKCTEDKKCDICGEEPAIEIATTGERTIYYGEKCKAKGQDFINSQLPMGKVSEEIMRMAKRKGIF